jgi:hypothetical protein
MRGPTFKGLIMKELRKEIRKNNKSVNGQANSGCLMAFCILGGAISTIVLGVRFIFS